jgi:hypothetical protein
MAEAGMSAGIFICRFAQINADWESDGSARRSATTVGILKKAEWERVISIDRNIIHRFRRLTQIGCERMNVSQEGIQKKFRRREEM